MPMPCPISAPISARCSDMLCVERVEVTCNRAGFRLVRYDGGWDFPIPAGKSYDQVYVLMICIDDLRKDAAGYPLDEQPIYCECEDYDHEFCEHDGLIWLAIDGVVVMRGGADAWCAIHARYNEVARHHHTVFVDECNRRVWYDGKGMNYRPYP